MILAIKKKLPEKSGKRAKVEVDAETEFNHFFSPSSSLSLSRLDPSLSDEMLWSAIKATLNHMIFDILMQHIC